MIDADLYTRAQGMQLRDALDLMKMATSTEKWEGVVMDIGCGPGTCVKKILVPHFADNIKIVAVDLVPNMIRYAQAVNGDEKVEYVVANIEDASTLREDWIGKISNVVSIYCMHWMKDQSRAFQNVYELLSPGGEVAMVFALSTPFWDHYDQLIENGKFTEYIKDVDTYIPDSHKLKYGVAHYREMLSEIGFEVLTCEAQERNFAYDSEEVCKCACAAVCALTKHIPEEKKEEFKDELLRIFYECNGRNPDGLPLLYYTALTLQLRKK